MIWFTLATGSVGSENSCSVAQRGNRPLGIFNHFAPLLGRSSQTTYRAALYPIGKCMHLQRSAGPVRDVRLHVARAVKNKEAAKTSRLEEDEEGPFWLAVWDYAAGFC